MAGSLKRKHKVFKSRHATKGQIKNANKGRIESQSSGPGPKHQLNKTERKNHSSQVMIQKRKQQEAKLKAFNGKNGCPRNICVIPLSSDINSVEIVNKFQATLDGVVDTNVPGTMFLPRFKQNLRFFVPNYANFYEVLDSARSADFCLFVLSTTTNTDDYGEKLIRCVSSQGCTSSYAVLWGDADKKVKTHLATWFGHFFAETRVFNLDNELSTLANTFCSKVPSGINWRDERPFIVAEKFELADNAIAVQGFVRGSKLNPNQLVHLPGVGDFEIGRIVSQDEQTWVPDSPVSNDPLAEEEIELNDYNEENNVVANAGVRIEGHEYVSEMIEADENVVQTIKQVPKGMSDYQASWLIEGEDYGLEQDAENPEEEADMLDDEEGELIDQEDARAEAEADTEMQQEENEEEHEHGLAQYREAKEAREDLAFPDEVEFDPHTDIKDRLKSYRGVRDLHAVEWDANERDERTPAEWSRIVRPGNLFATKNRLLKQEFDGADVGTRVIVYLPLNGDAAKLKQLVANVVNGLSVTLYGLLPLENKLSNLNLSITPDSEFDVSLKCKEPIVVQYGPRRLVIEPIYSTPGAQNDNGVYKMFRYLHPGHPATVTTLAPIMLSQAPVVYFTPGADPRLVGTGNVMDCDSNRVIVKTAVLTGHPFKINKKLVTIRYMFFNNSDVNWFKNVPLFTKWGCNGFIKESLGTHGYFKATFDRKINAQDTIAMALYKRAWPRRSAIAEF